MKLYISGPMSGIKDYNFPAFDAAAALLTAHGHEVFNPAEQDRLNGFDTTGMEGHELPEQGFDLRTALKADLNWIIDHAEGVVTLPGWLQSTGAQAEVRLAWALGLPTGSAEWFSPV